MTAAQFQTGDQVLYRKALYYARRNGNTVRLYRTASMRGRPVFTPRVSSVVPVNVRETPPAETQISYLYVLRDIDLPQTVRRLKIGITDNLAQRSRPYRTLEPASYFIVTVQLTSRREAALLESHMKQAFKEFRVDKSEVFSVRPHQIERELRRHKYTQCTDGHWRLNEAVA